MDTDDKLYDRAIRRIEELEDALDEANRYIADLEGELEKYDRDYAPGGQAEAKSYGN